MLLRSHGHGCVLLVVVLNDQSGTIGNYSTVGQTNAERRTDLGAFNSKAVVIGTVDIARDYQIVLEDFESFAGNHVNGK